MPKVISLSNDAYAHLRATKKRGDSFSDVVLRLIERERRKPLLKFFGAWPGNPEEIVQLWREFRVPVLPNPPAS